jgi:hypothetical protein
MGSITPVPSQYIELLHRRACARAREKGMESLGP